MAQRTTIPKRLYKYRPLNEATLELLVSDQIFYADPSKFNDPLDSQPTVKVDLPVADLKELLRKFVERRTSADLSTAANKINYRSRKTKGHIRQLSQRQAEQLLADIAFNATDPEYEVDDPEPFILRHYIENELLGHYDRGIVSLTERPDSSLMWSHYGDQHKGLCIGYSVPTDVESNIHRVRYRGSRLIETSKLVSMLSNSRTARRRVDEAVLFRKAEDWRYEREWRLIGDQGLHSSPLELEEVIFGMRCKPAIKYTVIKALENRGNKVKFYEARGTPDTFAVQNHPIEADDELFVHFPMRHREILEAFSNVDLGDAYE